LARLRSALVDVDFAIDSFVSSSALAGVFGNAVNTGSSMLARIGGAIVNVDFAIDSSVSFCAFAFVCVDLVVADTSVLAQLGWFGHESSQQTSSGR
jgi:hypothetical protein